MSCLWIKRGGGTTYLLPQTYDAWFPPDRSTDGKIHISYGPPRFANAADRATLEQQGIPLLDQGSTRDWTVPAGQTTDDSPDSPSYTYLRSLPTDPNRLYRLIDAWSQQRGVTHA